MEIIKMMIPYVIFICISTLITYTVEKSKLPLLIRRVLSFINIFFLAYMAAIRYGIGTDYYNHYQYFLEISQGSHYSRDVLDVGFVALVHFFSKIVKIGYPGVLFSLSFITCGSIWKTLSLLRRYISLTFSFFSFLLLYYQMTYNLMRQFCAASLIILSMAYLVNDKKLHSLFFIILGLCFHSSAIVVLPVIIFYKLFTQTKYNRIVFFIYLILFFAVALLPMYSNIIVFFLEKIGRYVYYFKVGMNYQHIGIGFFRYIFIFILPGIYYWKELRECIKIKYFFSVSTIGFILWLMSYVSENIAYRVSYNYLIAVIIPLGFYYKMSNKRSFNRYLNKALIIIPIVFFWVYDFFVLKANETVPYVTIFSNMH